MNIIIIYMRAFQLPLFSRNAAELPGVLAGAIQRMAIVVMHINNTRLQHELLILYIIYLLYNIIAFQQMTNE